MTLSHPAFLSSATGTVIKLRFFNYPEVRIGIIEGFFLAWLKTQSPRTLPKSSFGQAINYCLIQWEKLEAFMLDGRLEIDNAASDP